MSKQVKKARNWADELGDTSLWKARCKALAEEIWPDKCSDARCLDCDEDDVVTIEFWPQFPKMVSLVIDECVVIDFVEMDRLEPALKALAGHK